MGALHPIGCQLCPPVSKGPVQFLVLNCVFISSSLMLCLCDGSQSTESPNTAGLTP